ncbi:hypothetical protein [Kitasatospora sp. NPDC017646]
MLVQPVVPIGRSSGTNLEVEKDVLGGASVPAGGSVSLGAWDVRVFVAG